MSRTARRIRAIAKLALILSTSAHAGANKRYLVRFKSSRTFRQVQRAARLSLVNAEPKNDFAASFLSSGAATGHGLNELELFVVESDRAAAIEALRRHPSVAMVEEEIFHPGPKPFATGRLKQIQFTQSDRAPSIARPWGIDQVRAPEAWAFGRGETARTMVLDTGLDREHPALKSNFEKGRNFLEDVVSEDVTDVVGHGTHVSGTIAASGEAGGLIGVAPKSRLLMAKVCGEHGCSSVAIAEALNWAVEEHVDVVNMSLGGMFLTESEASALDQAERAGVFVAAASGNDGKGYIEYPAAYDSVLAVGAVGRNLERAAFSQYGVGLGVVAPGVSTLSSVPRGTGRSAQLSLATRAATSQINESTCFVGSPLTDIKNVALVSAGLGQAGDFLTATVRGQIVLLERGSLTFAEKVKNAAAAGAIGVLVYNNAEGLMQGTLVEGKEEAEIPAWLITKAEGERLKAQLASGEKVVVNASVSASDYASFEGTSMATPHVSGVAALVRAANPHLSPADVRAILRETATSIKPDGANEYGSGLVNAEAAVLRARAASARADLAPTN